MSKIIFANWKLNPLTLAEAQELAGKIDLSPKHRTVLCPPMTFLSQISYPHRGAQDCFWKVKGAYTGETSPATLKSMGVEYCIVGHSERRSLGENDEMVHAKIVALQEQGIIPVLCIGYGTTVNEDELDVIDTLQEQLDAALTEEVDRSKIIVAYEPVWAISTGNPSQTKKVATPEHAEKIALFIKNKYQVGIVLYGGSVTSVNAKGYLEQNNIAGLLVGGASLLADDFNKIINISL